MTSPLRTCLAALLLAVAAHADNPVPAQLPAPTDTPPATDRPVKVYILSGQSNMVGFGRLTGGPVYPSIYLCADPGIKPGRMPVGDSALLPHAIYQDADGQTRGAMAHVFAGAYDAARDYAAATPVAREPVALGTPGAQLPTLDGPHTVQVRAYIDVPMDGTYALHPGFGASEDAVATLDGQTVYTKAPGADAEITKTQLKAGTRYPLTITYHSGGSAAFWLEMLDLPARGTLEALTQAGRFPAMVDENGEWTQRVDVTLNDAYLGKGRTQPLSPTANGNYFGPELGFGYVMGTYHDEPVLLIKSDIGNRSLAWDVLPPGSERYTVDGKVYAGYKDPQASWPVGEEPKPGGWYAGKQYDDYTAAVHTVLDNFDTIYPQYKDQGYEIAGFVWWQGHKDQNEVHASRYEQNLVRLIKAWRAAFNAPDAKFVIATIAFGGWELDGPGETIAEAQLAVSGETGKYPEFAGNVKTIEARGFWRGLGESASSQGYHYNHNAETYLLVGDALGRAMVELEGGQAEQRQGVSRPPQEKQVWPKNPTLAQAAEMVFSDAFISDYAKDPAEPSPADYDAMAPALQPIILGSLIPGYVSTAAKVPRYRRHGLSMVPIVTGERPKDTSESMLSQLDNVIDLYNAAGIHDYDWRPFGPAMRDASWQYYSFDPPEQQDRAKSNRYRDITLPAGMETWYAVDFDAAAAGWQTGAAPFGQRDGQQVAQRENCREPRCGCDITPNTLWAHEVLLMRQTFQLPALEPDHRYRLVVGGASHAFSGEGFAIYVNGKLFAEVTDGFYKRGGTRGAYVYSDFMPDFSSGQVTIAVKSFLRSTYHRNKQGPWRGQVSVWLESAKLPETVVKAVAADQE